MQKKKKKKRKEKEKQQSLLLNWQSQKELFYPSDTVKYTFELVNDFRLSVAPTYVVVENVFITTGVKILILSKSFIII